MKTVLIALAAALGLAGCAGAPREPYPAERRDARCAMGCAHYHWEEAGRYDRLYDPVYVDEYGYGEGERGGYGAGGGYDYRYQSDRSYERGGGYDGYGYGEHRYAPPPPPSYPRPGDDAPYPPPPAF